MGNAGSMQRSESVCLPCGFLQRTRKAQHKTQKWTQAALTRKEEDELFKNILLIQVVGDVDDPDIIKKPLPELDDTLQRLFPETAPRTAGR